MKNKFCLLAGFLLLVSTTGFAQVAGNNTIQGKLFIIGGGSRSVQLMKTLVATAHLQPADYIVVLPMSSEEPDTSFYYIQHDFIKVCANKIVELNFTKQLVNDKKWLDSLQKAKLIFITGGDQNRFMGIVLHTPVQDAIATAYLNGATIAGTSAGAAVMSKQMITGNEYSGDTVVEGTFKKIRPHLVEIKEGLGLIEHAVIDQHFIVRSRYNRLIGVLAAFPAFTCIGIDEATAIIVEGKKVTVTGESQVIKLQMPEPQKMHATVNGLINMRNVQLDILTAGDIFELTQ